MFLKKGVLDIKVLTYARQVLGQYDSLRRPEAGIITSQNNTIMDKRGIGVIGKVTHGEVSFALNGQVFDQRLRAADDKLSYDLVKRAQLAALDLIRARSGLRISLAPSPRR